MLAREIDPEMRRFLNFFATSYHPHGHLPASGGMMDQTAVFIDAMGHLSSERSKLEAEKFEKLKREQ